MDSNLFFEHFEILLATNAVQQAQAYHIRYQVYCEEYGFEEASAFPNQQERDAYDHRAIQCLVVHKATQQAVGCIRLIHADPAAPQALFPVEDMYQADAVFPPVHFSHFSRTSISELSRLALLPSFRIAGRKQQQTAPMVNLVQFSAAEEALRPLLPVSLFFTGLALTSEGNWKHNFAVMEPRLVRRLQHVGIYYRQIGAVVEYHGQRAPFQLDVEASLNNISSTQADFYAQISQRVRTTLHQDPYGTHILALPKRKVSHAKQYF